jgi:DNA (cytosine-5)-methyltransferase 1
VFVPKVREGGVSRPRLLDLFCGAGGAAVGYHRAGFDVVGVDIAWQPRYPFHFYQGNALKILEDDHEIDGLRAWSFDAIHASPPCQAFTSARVIHGRKHPDLLTPARELLQETGLPWVIENVPGAPMRPDLVLCGSQFPGLRSANGQLVRHRWFEFSDPRIAPALGYPCDHSRPTISVFGHGGHIYHGVEDWRTVMGIDWMTRDELSQAIPPDFAELVGHQLMQHVLARAA